MTEDDVLERFNLNVITSFVNYMNDAYCSYIARGISKKELFEELPPLMKKLIHSNIEAPIIELKPLSKDLKYGN